MKNPETGRRPIEALLDAVEWRAVDPPQDRDEALPYATHEGVLKLGDVELRVAQLSDGQRVIDAADLRRWFEA